MWYGSPTLPRNPTPEDATAMDLPNVVSPVEWQAALDDPDGRRQGGAYTWWRHAQCPAEVVR